MIRIGFGIILVLVVFMAVIPAAGHAAGLSAGDSQPFAGGFINIRKTGPIALASYPCAELAADMAGETSYRSLYGLKELTENRAGAAFCMKPLIFGVVFSSFGQAGYYHQSSGAVSLSAKMASFRFGMAVLHKRISFSESYAAVSLVSLTAGVSYTRRNISVYGVTRNMNQPSYTSGSRSQRPEAEFGFLYQSSNGLANLIQALFVRQNKPTAAIGQMFPLADIVDIHWLLVLSPVRFGGGLRITKDPLIITYRYSHHPVLGATHTISLTIFR